MENSNLIILLIICTISCQSKLGDKSNHNIVKDSVEKNKTFSVIDSLTKYIGTDSLYYFEKNIFYVGKANNIDFGLVSQTDSTFVFYQKTKTKWEIRDTLEMDALFGVEKQDLNNDSFADLVVIYNITGCGGNSENFVLLYNQNKNEFKHNSSFDLPNIQFDKKTKLIETVWFSGVVHCQSKETYKITGDSLNFNLGVICCPPNSVDKNNKEATLEFYKKSNGEKIIIKQITGKPDKLWKIFNKTFWDTSDE